MVVAKYEKLLVVEDGVLPAVAHRLALRLALSTLDKTVRVHALCALEKSRHLEVLPLYQCKEYCTLPGDPPGRLQLDATPTDCVHLVKLLLCLSTQRQLRVLNGNFCCPQQRVESEVVFPHLHIQEYIFLDLLFHRANFAILHHLLNANHGNLERLIEDRIRQPALLALYGLRPRPLGAELFATNLDSDVYAQILVLALDILPLDHLDHHHPGSLQRTLQAHVFGHLFRPAGKV